MKYTKEINDEFATFNLLDVYVKIIYSFCVYLIRNLSINSY